jgi:hypothetical protein
MKNCAVPLKKSLQHTAKEYNMSEYAKKLSRLAEKKKKLQAEEGKLTEYRKKEIGELVQRFDLLTASDKALLGALSEIQTALLHHPDKIAHWENEGSRFRASQPLQRKGTAQAAS